MTALTRYHHLVSIQVGFQIYHWIYTCLIRAHICVHLTIIHFIQNVCMISFNIPIAIFTWPYYWININKLLAFITLGKLSDDTIWLIWAQQTRAYLHAKHELFTCGRDIAIICLQKLLEHQKLHSWIEARSRYSSRWYR